MSDLQADITAIQDRLAAATREFHRAEATHDAAAAKAAQLREQLKREFDVENLEQASDWLRQAESQLRNLIAALDEALGTARTSGVAQL